MTRTTVRKLFIVASGLAVAAFDPTEYGGADRLQRDLAVLDPYTPSGLQQPADASRLLEAIGMQSTQPARRRAHSFMTNDAEKDPNHEPLPKRLAATRR